MSARDEDDRTTNSMCLAQMLYRFAQFWWLHTVVRPYPKKTPETLEKVAGFGCLLQSLLLMVLRLLCCLAWFIRLAGCQKILCQVAVCSNGTRCFSGRQELEFAVARSFRALHACSPSCTIYRNLSSRSPKRADRSKLFCGRWAFLAR